MIAKAQQSQPSVQDRKYGNAESQQIRGRVGQKPSRYAVSCIAR